MKIIAHRGNLSGPNKHENDPEYLKDAIQAGFDVEADVWYVNNGLYLGHDKPEYHVSDDFLLQNDVWCHAKDLVTMQMLLDLNVHCFFHNQDACTLTSQKWIWCYTGFSVGPKSIVVMPEHSKELIDIEKVGGICTDLPLGYYEYLLRY